MSTSSNIHFVSPQQLEVNDKKYLLNEVNVSRWYTYLILSRLRKPVDKDLWVRIDND